MSLAQLSSSLLGDCIYVREGKVEVGGCVVGVYKVVDEVADEEGLDRPWKSCVKWKVAKIRNQRWGSSMRI